jgi:SNF family Na+-dependent transporter
LFCFNWGFTFFDIIDHYISVYLVLLMGILQTVACGWIHCFDDAKAAGSKLSVLILVIGYFSLMVPLPVVAYFGFPNDSWIAIPVFWGYFIVIVLASFFTSRLSFSVWYEEIFFYGVRPIAQHMISLAQTPYNIYWNRIFEFWWCWCVKYACPWAIWTLLVMTFQADVDKAYGDYHVGW